MAQNSAHQGPESWKLLPLPFGLRPMWKLIFILILVIYLLSKVASVLFRVMGRQKQPPSFRPPGNGNIHVDGNGKQTPRRGGIKGGDYVDYEEVK